MASTSVSLPYNRHVFVWARERLGLDQSSVADSIKVKPERVAGWESGERMPTVNQARKLAKLYDRPFLEFFAKDLPDVPSVELAPDYRFYSDPPAKEEIIALMEVQRWAEEQRLNALDLFELIGEEPPSFPKHLHADLKSNIDEIAAEARKEINFPVDAQVSMKSNEKADLPKILRRRFEQIGVLVLKQSGLTKLRARGLCLYADPIPVIVYGNESPGAQSFTLAHEFAHILLQSSAISGPPISGNKATTQIKRIEMWCNRFSAAFLVPKDSMAEDIGKPGAPAQSISDHDLEILSKRYAISTHAMLIRLVNLGYVSSEYYWNVKRSVFLHEEKEYKSFGRAPYYGSRYVNSRGDLYTSLVLEAWDSGRITNHNAAEFMGIKNLAHLGDIQEKFGR